MSPKPTLATAPGSMRIEIRRSAGEAVIDRPLWYDSRRPYATPAYMMPMPYEQRWLAGQLKTVNL